VARTIKAKREPAIRQAMRRFPRSNHPCIIKPPLATPDLPTSGTLKLGYLKRFSPIKREFGKKLVKDHLFPKNPENGNL
jgi:hypothetical protein